MMLTLPRLLLRNLAYHWRGNLAVLLGVAVGSAVLTGALLVGDSLRGSLRARAERQLAGIDTAAMFPRPVRAAVADGMPGNTAPVLLLQGSIQKAGSPESEMPYLGRVSILGVDARFGPEEVTGVDWSGSSRTWQRGEVPIVLSERVAKRLGVAAGDRIEIGVPRFSDLPRSSAFAKRSSPDVTATGEFTVAAVLPPDAVASDFSLNPTPSAPLNVYIPIAALSDLVRAEADRTDDPLATALFSSGASIDELNTALRQRLKPDDYGLELRSAGRRRYLSVESEEMVLSPGMVDATAKTAAKLGLRFEETIVYVADTLAHGDQEIPYPVVAGLNAAAAPPLGSFLPPGVSELRDNEVVLVQWTDSPLEGLKPGDRLTMTYFNPDIEGEGKIETAELTLRGYIPLKGAANDRDLTPLIPGVTDPRVNLFDWDRPPMLPKEKIRARVPDTGPRARFWNLYRATPMAYVDLATAKRLFASRYGSVTSVRVAPAEKEDPDDLARRLSPAILEHLDPASAGMAFEPVRERLLAASKGGTDFGGLFLGFSLFLIAAALMLVGLLFRLALDRRAKEIGLLLATGYAVRHVRRLILIEGLILACIGAAIGLIAAVGYNRLLLHVLLDLWPDPEVATFLRPHSTPLSFALGFGLAVVMALGALWLSVRGLVKVTPPALLRGETMVPRPAPDRSRFGWWVLILALPIGLGLIAAGAFVQNPDYQAMTFFGGGAMLLTAGLAAVWTWMKRTRHREVNGRGLPALTQLGARNAARNPSRSLLTAALLAAAAFLLVAVESFRREPGAEFLDFHGGSGGFNLIAESDVPLYQMAGTPLAKIPPEPNGTPNVFPLRLRAGDDASCMNLYQATRPRILGVPDSLIQRGGFKFYQTDASTDEEKANPWLLLEPKIDPFKYVEDMASTDRTVGEREPIPVFCENNTAVWMLKTGVGGEITVPDDAGNEVKLRIVGTFADSPFQSELIMSDANFVRLFPKQDGFRVFLIRTPPEEQAKAARSLELGLRDHGFIATATRDRVAAYQAVIGAYLSTFQLLGGFGLLLGVLGLAVVVLRGVWERVGELALLRSVGYRTRQLQFLVLAEHAVLLVIGLAAGVLAALASVAPHIAEGASVPWARLAGILALVLLVGLVVASAATAGILRVPVIPALRRE
jgi:ABC-type antimicrobial peptide transport system permease subunit